MEDMEARVWQRVGGREPMELPQLARLCREAAADYRNLAALCAGQARQTLLELHREAAAAAQAVSGMAMLRGLELPHDQTCWPEKQLRRGLALAYRRSRELWQAFQSWSASSEFGFSFRALARREEAASTRLLALLANCPVRHT